MARTLWLLRHGDAEPHGAREDSARRLTPRGERQSRSAGRALARLGVHFELVLTSPRVRAFETARLVCAELELEPVVHDSLGGGFRAGEAAELLAAIGDGGSLLLVGHEPDLSTAVAQLTGARVEMRKGGVAAIREGMLLNLLRPRDLELVAGL